MNRILFGFLAVFVILAACSKDPIIDDGPDPKDPVLVNEKVYFASVLPATIDNALRMSLSSIITNPEDAVIIVVKSSDMYMNEGLLKKAWKDGKIIVEVEPETEIHQKFWSSLGVPSYMLSSVSDLMLIGIQKCESYCLQNPFIVNDYMSDLEIEEDENASPSDEPADWEDQDSEVISFDEEVEYLNSKLSLFAEWLNEKSLTKNEDKPTGLEKFRGDISSFFDNSDFSQVYTKVFTVGADDYQLCKIASSKPDKITRHAQVSVQFTITPLYIYERNTNAAGDYYFVTATITSHNGDLYGTYKKKHGAIWTYAHAFYSENIHWTADIITGKSDYAASFHQNPTPQTTESSSSYSASFSTNINASGQGGRMGGHISGNLTLGANFTWTQNVSRELKDQMVSDKSINSTVNYDYLCMNFIKDDDVNKAIPLIARSNQVCNSSWCWRVAGTKDNDTTANFTFTYTLDPQYGYMYRHTSWWAEGHEKHNIHLLPENNRTTTFSIVRPDRLQRGILHLKCTDPNYLNHVVILDSQKDTAATANSAYEEHSELNFQLPVGKYTVEFDVRTGGGTLIGSRRSISDVAIKTGEITDVPTFSE